MGLRALLSGLIVAATAAFVVGTVIERNSSSESAHHEAAVGEPAERRHGRRSTVGREGGESTGQHAHEGPTTERKAATEEPHAELRPLGIDVEAWPFVALAAAASLALAAAAWLGPRQPALLGLVAPAMLIFAALDLREVLHQADHQRHWSGDPRGRRRGAPSRRRGRGRRAGVARVAPGRRAARNGRHDGGVTARSIAETGGAYLAWVGIKDRQGLALLDRDRDPEAFLLG